MAEPSPNATRSTTRSIGSSPGKVVRKDLVRKVKVGANVPVFVLEFLLGKYCASSDEMAIQMGLKVVNDSLADNYIRPDEFMKAQSRRLNSFRRKDAHVHRQSQSAPGRLRVLGRTVNFNHKFVHVPEQYVRDYDRLLTGGIWAQVDMRFEYDEEQLGARIPSGSRSCSRSRLHRLTWRNTSGAELSLHRTNGSISWCAAWGTSRM